MKMNNIAELNWKELGWLIANFCKFNIILHKFCKPALPGDKLQVLINLQMFANVAFLD